MLAAALTTDAFQATTSTNTAYLHNGAYWYFYPGYSMGFADVAAVNLNPADLSSADCASRLSWHLDNGAGGYRAGCTTSLNTDPTWTKLIFSMFVSLAETYNLCPFCPSATSTLKVCFCLPSG